MMIRTWTLFIFTLTISLLFPKSIFAAVVINEFVPNGEEWVEFYNDTESADYLKEYYIDDKVSGGQPKKKLTELNTTNPKYPYFVIGENYLNNDGDDIVLLDPDGNIVNQYHYGSVPSADMSIGRSPDQSGSFAFLQSPTKGSANSAAKVDPTPTASPTPSPSPTPISSPSPTPTKSPSPTPKKSSSPAPITLGEQEVLGAGVLFTPTPAGYSFMQSSPVGETNSEQGQLGGTPFAAAALMGTGTVFMVLATLPFLKKRKAGYNVKADESSANLTEFTENS